MISFGRPEYIVQLKKMWHEIFGDTQSYIDSFFEHMWVEDNTLVYVVQDVQDVQDAQVEGLSHGVKEDNEVHHVNNEKAVAALYMIPYRMKFDGEEIDIVYLYALVTAPEYRGRGIMSELIEMSAKICKERGYRFSVLIPAERSLFEYYRRFGYSEFIKQTKLEQTREEVSEIAKKAKQIELKPANADEIWKAYLNGPFHREGSIILSKEQNEFYIDELKKEGGEAYIFSLERGDASYSSENEHSYDRLKSDTDEGYVLMRVDEDKLNIFESNANQKILPGLYAALLDKYNFKTLTFYDPVCVEDSVVEAQSHNLAMAHVLNSESIQGNGEVCDGRKDAVVLDMSGKGRRFIGRVLM